MTFRMWICSFVFVFCLFYFVILQVRMLMAGASPETSVESHPLTFSIQHTTTHTHTHTHTNTNTPPPSYITAIYIRIATVAIAIRPSQLSQRLALRKTRNHTNRAVEATNFSLRGPYAPSIRTWAVYMQNKCIKREF
jgi:hypothetical protein